MGLIAGHISHRFTIEQTAATLQDWEQVPALRSAKLCIGLDANETFMQPGGLLGKATLFMYRPRGADSSSGFLERDICLPTQDMHLPSHFPYNPDLTARRIDYVAARGIHISSATVGSARDRASSDHEPILASARHPIPRRSLSGVTWCARQLKPDCQSLLDSLQTNWGDPHKAIADISARITEPAQRALKFRESRELKGLRRQAKILPPGAPCRDAWKTISRQLRQERKSWQAEMAKRAGSHDWNALRSLKAKSSKTNWAAALLDDPQWENQLRTHMSSIFCKQAPDCTRAAMQSMREEATCLCKSTPWRPFSEREMRLTMAKWEKPQSYRPRWHCLGGAPAPLRAQHLATQVG